MKNSNNSATVITDCDIILYYTSFKIEDGFLIIFNDEKYLFTDKRYYFSAMALAKAKCFLIESNSLLNFIKSNDLKRVGIVYSLTTVDYYEKLKSYGVEVFDDSDRVFKETSIKSENEIALIKKSCEILEKSLETAYKSLKVGITERQFAGILEYEFKLNGADKPAFDTIVAFGAGTSVPHYKTGDVVLKNDMPVLIDCGVNLNGYLSDITRSFYFGKAPKKYLDAYTATYNAHQKAYVEIKSGMSGRKADAIARDYLHSLGYGEYFTHSLGHGVGVKIHELPRVSPKSNEILVNGNVFSIEPGVYFDGEFGIRIEDTVYLKDGKCVSFYKLRKDVAEFSFTQK